VRAIVVSSFGLLLTSAFEISITVLSGSVALLSDALHNLGDVFTRVGVYSGFRASRKQPTRRYPYGYGRAEDLTGIIIVIAIWSSAALAGWQSYDKLVSGRGTTHLTLGMVAAVVGIVGNQLVARYKLAVGRAIKSAPLLSIRPTARHPPLAAGVCPRFPVRRRPRRGASDGCAVGHGPHFARRPLLAVGIENPHLLDLIDRTAHRSSTTSWARSGHRSGPRNFTRRQETSSGVMRRPRGPSYALTPFAPENAILAAATLSSSRRRR
jgi:hypothetical protein